MKKETVKKIGKTIAAIAAGALLFKAADSTRPHLSDQYSLVQRADGSTTVMEHYPHSIHRYGLVYSTEARRMLTDEDGDGIIDYISQAKTNDQIRISNFKFSYNEYNPINSDFTYQVPKAEWVRKKRQDNMQDPEFQEADELLNRFKYEAKTLKPVYSGEDYIKWGQPDCIGF